MALKDEFNSKCLRPSVSAWCRCSKECLISPCSAMKYLIIVIFLGISSCANDVCFTKDGIEGRCKGYADCPCLQNLLLITPMITLPSLLEQYGGCGAWNDDTYLCCPVGANGKTCSLIFEPPTASPFNELSQIPTIQSSVAAIRRELDELQSNCGTALGQVSTIQSSITAIRRELAELQGNHGSKTRCKNGWVLFANSCYFFGKDEGDWFHGRRQCLSMGSDYVKVSDNSEWTFLYNEYGNYWIGLNDFEEEGTFKWISDNSTMTDLNLFWWHDDNPDNKYPETGEQCVQYLYYQGRKRWNDASCYLSFPYICEMAAAPSEDPEEVSPH